MSDFAVRLLPLLVLFASGVVLGRLRVLRPVHADALLRLVVYIGLPALVLASISRAQLRPEFSFLPVAAVLTIIVTWPTATLMGRALVLPRPVLGAFVVGPMIVNIAVLYPFVLAAWDGDGLVRLALVDFGNSLLTLTLTFGVASAYGGDNSNLWSTVRRVLSFPPFWALSLALGLNISGIGLAEPLADAMQRGGHWVALLVMVALGIYFDIRRLRSLPLLTALALRMGLGGLLGLLWAELFDLEGLTRAVLLVASVAPVGFNTLVFAAMTGLDKQFAASLASASLLLALLYLPVLLFLLP